MLFKKDHSSISQSHKKETADSAGGGIAKPAFILKRVIHDLYQLRTVKKNRVWTYLHNMICHNGTGRTTILVKMWSRTHCFDFSQPSVLAHTLLIITASRNFVSLNSVKLSFSSPPPLDGSLLQLRLAIHGAQRDLFCY